MKVVITKVPQNIKAGEPSFKAGEEVNLTGAELDTIQEAGYSYITAAEHALQQSQIKARENAVDKAIADAVTKGSFLPKEDTSSVKAKALKMEEAEAGCGVEYIANLPVKAKNVEGRKTAGGEGEGRIEVGKVGIRENIKAYIRASEPFNTKDNGGLVRAAAGNPVAMKEAAQLSKDRALIMRDIVEAVEAGADFRMDDVVKAADYADPAANNPLGVLNTGLQLAFDLGFLANQLAPLNDITTDISNQPALFGQVCRSRYISVPGVQLKTSSTSWSGVTGNTTDVNVAIDTHAGVPISINNMVSGATIRNLHNEQKTPQLYALGEYIIYKLISTALNGNTRIANDGTSTSTITLQGKGDGITAGTSFKPQGGKFDLATFVAGLPLAMDLSKFPGGDEAPGDPLQRFAWIHSSIYAGLASDTNLLLNQSIQGIKPGAINTIATGSLPQLGNITLRKSQLMTDTVTTTTTDSKYYVTPGDYTAANTLGIAGTRSSLMFVSRVPTDYTKILPDVPSTAAIEMVTEPRTGLTFMVVKHLDHSYETSNLRVQLMFGTAIGDERQGFKIAAK